MTLTYIYSSHVSPDDPQHTHTLQNVIAIVEEMEKGVFFTTQELTAAIQETIAWRKKHAAFTLLLPKADVVCNLQTEGIHLVAVSRSGHGIAGREGFVRVVVLLELLNDAMDYTVIDVKQTTFNALSMWSKDGNVVTRVDDRTVEP